MTGTWQIRTAKTLVIVAFWTTLAAGLVGYTEFVIPMALVLVAAIETIQKAEAQ